MIRITHDGEGAFTLWDGDVACGHAQAHFGETVELLAVTAPDDLLAEGLVRAVLNAGRERGLLWAFCCEDTLFPLLQRLRFMAKGTQYAVDIPAFFARRCSGE